MNWPVLMEFGLGTLRLSPQAFWSMTPRELSAAARALHGPVSAPMDGPALAALRTRYPDTSP
jgi:uncharacterized phage protein (TIGR02216 family)